MKRLSKLSISIVVLLSASCATDKAYNVRSAKRVTLGYLGAAVRPVGGAALVVGGRLSSESKLYVEKDRSKATVSKDDSKEYFNVKQKESNVHAALHLYPWKTSAFFLGLSGEYAPKKFTYDEETTASTAASPAYTPVVWEQTDTLVGIPIGWDWIWENGFSLFFDFGPRFLAGTSEKYATNGESGNVSLEKRNLTIETIKDYEKNRFRLGGTMIIGYSF